MSLIPKHISFDNIVFPELKLDRRPVMKVREWLKTRRIITNFKTIPPSLEKRVFSIEYGIQFEIIDGKVVSKTVKLHEKR